MLGFAKTLMPRRDQKRVLNAILWSLGRFKVGYCAFVPHMYEKERRVTYTFAL